MLYRSIPGLRLPVSQLSLGGWLTLGDSLPGRDGVRLLHDAIAGGVNMIDLADVYADGAAEVLVGQFLGETDRDRLILTSKVFWPTSGEAGDRGLSRRHIHASIDRSLQRLGTDHLDLYYCHREDPSVPLAETVTAMGDLVRAGKISAWGTSCWRPETLRAAHTLAQDGGHPPPAVEQSPYNLLERWIEDATAPCCKELGMALVAFSPLAQGVLTGKYVDGRPDGSRGATTTWLDGLLQRSSGDAVRAFVECCRARDVHPAVVALSWASRQDGITSAVFGASSSTQLAQNLQAAQFELDTELAEELQRIFPRQRRSLLRRLLRRVVPRW